MTRPWRQDEADLGRRLWGTGKSSSSIAERLGRSPNSVIGKAHRDRWTRGELVAPPPEREPTPDEEDIWAWQPLYLDDIWACGTRFAPGGKKPSLPAFLLRHLIDTGRVLVREVENYYMDDPDGGPSLTMFQLANHAVWRIRKNLDPRWEIATSHWGRHIGYKLRRKAA